MEPSRTAFAAKPAAEAERDFEEKVDALVLESGLPEHVVRQTLAEMERR